MSENKLALIVKESTGIEQTKAQFVLEQFQDFANQAAVWEQKTRELVITDASQTAEMALAKSARLNLRDIRVAAEKTKKKLKEGILVEGKLIDAMYNFIEGVTKPIEAELKEKEEFVERQEAARIFKLKTDREEQLAPYGVETQHYGLGSMSDEAFRNLFDMVKTSYEAKQVEARRLEEERIAREKKEADEKAERERLDREERAKQAAENERLKKEAEEREQQIAAERAKAEAERKAIEEKARKEAEEREAADRKRQAELDQAKLDLQEEMDRSDAEIRKANEAADKARRELAEKKAEEDRAKKAEADSIEAERKKLESASDKEKLLEYFDRLTSILAPVLNGKPAEVLKNFKDDLAYYLQQVGEL